jgi:hypothetical protein
MERVVRLESVGQILFGKKLKVFPDKDNLSFLVEMIY